MTKICAPLFLFASLALPLAHGCGDSSLACLGTPVACANREVASCNGGCSVVSGCLGGSVSCESLTDRPELCAQTPGCTYLGSCAGRAGCENVGFEECAETPGCQQVRRCGGGDVGCEGLEDDQCELYPECRLGDECRGTADACEDLGSSAECSAAPGCFPADTRPALLD